MSYKGRDIIHIADFSKEEILHLLDVAESLKREPQPSLLKGKILSSCFYEPSTRTRLSFESAMHRLGGSVIGFQGAENTSTKKGESLSDSMKMLDYYADIALIRHPREGAAQLAADSIKIPVINAGDGSNQHPTQTFLDLFTIREAQGRIDELSIGLAGDLKYGRTVHSLAEALIPFNCRLYFIAPESLEMPKPICDRLKESGVKFSFHRSLHEVIPKLDILYMTRIQEERFQDRKEFQKINQSLCVDPDLLAKGKTSLKVMHPLPRVKEIDTRIDTTPQAYYFEQAGNGLYTRQALLALILLGDIPS